ncbi:Pentatricopeptide repeat-containing protein At5g50280, chloroplastic [Linum perenne]
MAAAVVTAASPSPRRAPPSSSSPSFLHFFHSISPFPTSQKSRYPIFDKQWRRPPFPLFPAPHSSPSSFVALLGQEAALAEEEEEEPSSHLTEGEIPRLAWNFPVNATLGEQLSQYEGKISSKQCEEVLETLAKEENNKELQMNCIYFFQWMRSQEPPLVTPRAYTVIFPFLGKAGMGDELLTLFNSLPRSEEYRDVFVYSAAMSGFLNCRRYDDACKVFEIMEENHIDPNQITCHKMILIMRRQGRSPKEQWDFFQKMNRKGVNWSSEVVVALIRSFCIAGLKEEALMLFWEMEKKGIAPNVNMYNTLMNAYRRDNQVEEAEGLFAEMKAIGIKPTYASYGVLIDSYSRRMDPENVGRLLKEMQDDGFELDTTSYKLLFCAYGNQGKSDLAAAILTMKRTGIKLASHSYSALVHAYSVRGCPEQAYQVFEDMQLEGFKPGIDTYTVLLDAFKHAGDTKTLIKLWKRMKNDNVQWKRMTFNTILDCFAKRGCYSEAVDVIQEFRKFGFPPTVMTYNMLMNAYARGGQHSKLPQLLEDMLALTLKPDSVTYLTMIYAYVHVGDFKTAFFYHKQMVENGKLPDASSYKKLKKVLHMKAAMMKMQD